MGFSTNSLPIGITPESIFKPHDSHPRNHLIANAFFMAGFVETWGRGYELITEAFKSKGLEVPTIEEEFGGVRVIIKREVFYGVQKGGRIDPKTGKLIIANDLENVTKDVTKNVTKKMSPKKGPPKATLKPIVRNLKILILI